MFFRGDKDDLRILLDTGASNSVVYNAPLLGVDLLQ
jgi:metal-dependent hydrolase (beta-lactamase superfamily II)